MSDSILAIGAITKMSTNSSWKDLSVKRKSIEQIRQLEKWLNDSNSLTRSQGSGKKGYSALFSGASGTGKTLAAELLGKYSNQDVYSIDLSQLASKYIGETEKNLDRIFSKAAQKNWILFFDEADVLFGKRTNVKDSHDRYANQETSYLLNSIEMHSGLAILSSNSATNLSQAIRDSFDTVIEFKTLSLAQQILHWFLSLFGQSKNSG